VFFWRFFFVLNKITEKTAIQKLNVRTHGHRQVDTPNVSLLLVAVVLPSDAITVTLQLGVLSLVANIDILNAQRNVETLSMLFAPGSTQREDIK
jgi:hypothetical protein